MSTSSYDALIARIEAGEDIPAQQLVLAKQTDEATAKRDAEAQAAAEAVAQAKARHAERNAALTKRITDAIATYKAEAAPLLEQDATLRAAAIDAVKAHRAVVDQLAVKFKAMTDTINEVNGTPNYDESPATIIGGVVNTDGEAVHMTRYAF